MLSGRKRSYSSTQPQCCLCDSIARTCNGEPIKISGGTMLLHWDDERENILLCAEHTAIGNDILVLRGDHRLLRTSWTIRQAAINVMAYVINGCPPHERNDLIHLLNVDRIWTNMPLLKEQNDLPAIPQTSGS